MGQIESTATEEDDTINTEKYTISSRRPSPTHLTDSEVACEEAAHLAAEQQTQQDDADHDGGSYCEYPPDLPPPPDGGYGWVVVVASFICNMILDGVAYSFGLLLPYIVADYGETKGKAAWVGSILSGMYLSVGPVVSALTNRYGCRTVCIAGGLISTAAFGLSALCPTISWLMLVYGVIGGTGFGLIYLPAVVCVGYYFETKRSLATGIAVCGSGVGTFAFAPLVVTLLELYGWRMANVILAGLLLNCVLCGALMRPLRYPKSNNRNSQPLLQRMAAERRIQMERGSIGGSYFMVQLPDGTMERRLKQPLNIDPGVHSSLNLDQMAAAAATVPQGILPTVPTLPTITEAKVSEQSSSSGSPSPGESTVDVQPPPKPAPTDTSNQNKVASASSAVDTNNTANKKMPRNASQPAFSTHVQGLPKNGSVPTFDRIRKTSFGERFKPTLEPIKASTRTTTNAPAVVVANGDSMKRLRNNSNSSFIRNNNSEVDVESLMAYTASKASLFKQQERVGSMVRPFSRKDIFYSGSVVNLPEYHQSQKSLTNYRQSIMSIPRPSQMGGGGQAAEGEPGDICPCLVLPESFKSALNQMLDLSLLKDPVFLMIGVSNLFAMAGIYVPFVYLVDCAIQDGVEAGKASFLLSIIGITNTFGRVACGYFADFPWVNALLVNNICLVVCTVAVLLTPLCNSYATYIVMAVFFGIAISGYISLTSIILVDLLGLDKLTNSFGLLILFRGAAAIFGSPIAGAIYDSTKSYDVPFYVAGGFFAISTLTSFLAPCIRTCIAPAQSACVDDADDQLTPIDEGEEEMGADNDDEDEDDEEEEDQPITMGIGGAATYANGHATVVPPTAVQREIKQIESVL